MVKNDVLRCKACNSPKRSSDELCAKCRQSIYLNGDLDWVEGIFEEDNNDFSKANYGRKNKG